MTRALGLVHRRDVLLAGAAMASGLLGCGEPPPPNVILITLDTTRLDRLGVYGNPRGLTPHLDALASRSVVFSRAIAASSWTLPSHASLFTGKLPTSHGAQYDPEGSLRLTQAIEGPDAWRGYRVRTLSANEVTLASVLRDAGYRTGAVVAGPWMKRVFGLDLGFEHYDDGEFADVNGRLASEVTAGALRFLRDVAGTPFFLFLNYFDPHGPYDAPAPFGGRFGGEPSDKYDEEVVYMDHHVGRLLHGLEQMRLFDSSLIVVTADHGELLGEHGKMGHGTSLFEEELRVPFFVKLPGSDRAVTRRAPVHHIDVLPIVLDRLGIPVPPGVQGSLPSKTRRPLVAEVHPLDVTRNEGDWLAMYIGSQKILWNGRGDHELYDIDADPTEQRNLYREDDEDTVLAVGAVKRYFDSLPRPGAGAAPATLDERTLEAIRSLGYVP